MSTVKYQVMRFTSHKNEPDKPYGLNTEEYLPGFPNTHPYFTVDVEYDDSDYLIRFTKDFMDNYNHIYWGNKFGYITIVQYTLKFVKRENDFYIYKLVK